MDRTLLDLPFDKGNLYTIPYGWTAYGLGIDLDYYGGKMPPISWSLLFDPALSPSRVAMLDDARENFSCAMLYLYGTLSAPTQERVDDIMALMLEQKKRVVAYTDLRSDFLLQSKTVPVVFGMSPDLYTAQTRNKSLIFKIPKEGSFLIVDNFLISASSKNDDMVYQFLNYLYQSEVMTHYVERFLFFPVIKNLPLKNRAIMEPIIEQFSRLQFFKQVFTEEQLSTMWITLKS